MIWCNSSESFFKQRKSQYCKEVKNIQEKTFKKSNMDRSSHQRCSVKKGVLKNFGNFTG